MDTDWPLKKKISFGILLTLLLIPIPVILHSGVPALFLLILFSIAGGCCIWWAVGRLTPLLLKIYIRLHETATGKAGVSREVALLESQASTLGGRRDRLYRALRDSLFPTVIAFSLIGYILRDIGGIASVDVFVVLNFAPLVVAFMVPLWIVQDSRLYYLNGETGEVISLGRILNVRLKSIGGVVALALFVYTLYTVTGGIAAALEKLLVFFSHIYPAITVTSFIYHDRWHPGFAERTARAGLDAGKTAVSHRLAEKTR